MKQSIGILAYGSLIADPGWEIEEVRTRIIDSVITPFTVEYARSSSGRGDAPTLVPYDGGGKVQAQVFTLDTSVEDAIDRLYRREVGAVGSGRRYKHSKDPGPNKVMINRIYDEFGLDVVLYTCIGATIDKPDATKLAQLAIKSISKAESGKDGISYLMNAIEAGIRTPLTIAYVDEIKRIVGVDDLQDALVKLKKCDR